MDFVNSLVHISNPIGKYQDFSFVPWDEQIYPQFKGPENPEEIGFVFDLMSSRELHRIVDFAVGKGTELSGIIEMASARSYPLEFAEANEISDAHIAQAQQLFKRRSQSVSIHKGDWLVLDRAFPPYERTFDFGLLTGNSLALLGGGCRTYTNKAHQKVIENIARRIDKDGFLFIDHRNYDYIFSLMNLPIADITERFQFGRTVYYHGARDRVAVIPAYISETLIVLHYYDLERSTWSKLDYFPIFHQDMKAILNGYFEIEEVFSDFGPAVEGKSLFTQYLARRL